MWNGKDLIRVTFDQVTDKTEKAYLCKKGDREMWIPKSQVKEVTPGPGGITVAMTMWIAKEKGLTGGGA